MPIFCAPVSWRPVQLHFDGLTADGKGNVPICVLLEHLVRYNKTAGSIIEECEEWTFKIANIMDSLLWDIFGIRPRPGKVCLLDHVVEF